MVVSQPQEGKTDQAWHFPFTAEPVNHRVEGTEGQADQKGPENRTRQRPLGGFRWCWAEIAGKPLAQRCLLCKRAGSKEKVTWAETSPKEAFTSVKIVTSPWGFETIKKVNFLSLKEKEPLVFWGDIPRRTPVGKPNNSLVRVYLQVRQVRLERVILEVFGGFVISPTSKTLSMRQTLQPTCNIDYFLGNCLLFRHKRFSLIP